MYMDPQKLSQLDPKLRDAYQRVMGTTIPEPQAQTPTPPAPPIPDPTPTPVPQPQPEPESPQLPASEPQSIPTSEPAIPQPPPAPTNEPEPPPTPQPSIPTPTAQANNFVQMNSEVPATPAQNFTVPSPMSQAQNAAIKKKSGMMMPILFGIVGLVFIAIYTLFWTKILNFKLPFFP